MMQHVTLAQMCLFACVGRSHSKFLEQPYFRRDCEASEQRQTQASYVTVPHQLSTVMHEERDSIFINWVINKTSLLSLSLSPSPLCCYVTFLASCLSPAGLRVTQTPFRVSRTEWLVLAALQPLWKPVSFPQASQSFRNGRGSGSYLFLRFYSGPEESQKAQHACSQVDHRVLVFSPLSFSVSVSDLRWTVVLLKCRLFLFLTPLFFFFTETEKTCQHIWKISS